MELLDRASPAALVGVFESQNAVRREIGGVSLRPEFANFDGLVGFHSDELVVDGGNVEVFALADAIAPFEGLAQRVKHEVIFAQDLIRTAQVCIGHGEIGVEFDGTLKLGDGGGLIALGEEGKTKIVGFQRLQGRSGRLHKGYIIFFDGTERLAEFAAQVSGDLPERRQDLRFSGGFSLFAGQDLACGAIHSVEANHVLAAEIGDGASDIGFAAAAFADFARYVYG